MEKTKDMVTTSLPLMNINVSEGLMRPEYRPEQQPYQKQWPYQMYSGNYQTPHTLKLKTENPTLHRLRFSMTHP